ncbi:MAG TPA: hypothetical protein VFD35_09320 [Pricia sp.]|nr:hypothetical protein [Pricia sp.]
MHDFIKINPTNNPDCYQLISKSTDTDGLTLRFYQNYEEGIFDDAVDTNKQKSISIHLPIDALKFLKEIIDKSFEDIDNQKKYESELKNEELRVQFDPPLKEEAPFNEDLYDDDLKTYFRDNPDKRG